jgi:hypothetical protein
MTRFKRRPDLEIPQWAEELGFQDFSEWDVDEELDPGGLLIKQIFKNEVQVLHLSVYYESAERSEQMKTIMPDATRFGLHVMAHSIVPAAEYVHQLYLGDNEEELLQAIRSTLETIAMYKDVPPRFGRNVH